MFRRFASVLIPVMLLAACGRGDETRKGGAPNGAVVPDAEVANVATAPNGAEAAPVADAPRFDALAGIRVGSSIAQLRAQGLAVTRDDGPDPDNACGYARIAGLETLFVMLDGDTVVRIDVATPDHVAPGGLLVGMSEVEALRRLGAHALLRPNPQAGPASHRIVVHDAGAPFGFIAETDGRQVVSYRLGRWAAVHASDSCL
jgi:hypothetical protein